MTQTTILIPTYTCSHYLLECIDSILVNELVNLVNSTLKCGRLESAKAGSFFTTVNSLFLKAFYYVSTDKNEFIISELSCRLELK